MNLVTKTSGNAKIVVYGNVSSPIEGTAIMRVWRCKGSSLIKVTLVKGPHFHAILGRKAIIKLRLVKMTDNDEIFKPDTSGAEVYSTSGQEDLPTMENLVS